MKDHLDPKDNPFIRTTDAQEPVIDVDETELRRAIENILVAHENCGLEISLVNDEPWINGRPYQRAEPGEIRTILEKVREIDGEKYLDPKTNPFIKTED